jgi:hypothetical protein
MSREVVKIQSCSSADILCARQLEQSLHLWGS